LNVTPESTEALWVSEFVDLLQALVIGDLIEKSDGFKTEQKRIRDEANAKRIQAAVVKTEEHEKVTVVPQIEARLLPESVKKTPEPRNPSSRTSPPIGGFFSARLFSCLRHPITCHH
jgi:hypothetical protein